MSFQVDRALQVRKAIWVEVFTVLWMIVEAAVSITAGVLAGSALLTAFGIDSVIELVSGAILLWRLSAEAQGGESKQVEQAEHLAAMVVFTSLTLLCLYVLVTAIYGLMSHAQPGGSVAGIIISAVAVIVMPVLGGIKRNIAQRIGSGALRGDSASSFTCGYMAGAVLLGVGLNTLLHWWWAEYVASFVFLFWLVGETREVFKEVKSQSPD